MGEYLEVSLLERYQRLIEISRDLASTLDLDALLRRIVHAAADLSNAEQASILLYDQVKQELYFESATNLDLPMMSKLSVPLEGSIAGWIVTNRQPIIISDASQDSRYFGQVAQVTNTPTTSLLGVPLVTKDKVVGALEAINKLNGEFTEEDQNILTTLGAQAAIAIENAHLFQQSDLIAELVHELRTPLASLSTAIHLLLRPEVPEDQRNRISEIIRNEILRLSDLTSAFLDLSRLESGRAQFHPTNFDPRSLLEDCVEMMHSRATEKGLSLTLEIPDPLPSINADQDKIKQVIINLISNAIKYNRPTGSILLHAQAKAGELCISVSDTGYGIPPESLPNLFQKFYRVPGTENISTGTGLGLSICKRIIEAHRGTIDVQSSQGVGSTFTVHLPYSNPSK
jgi:signal transduction histidine kinase